MNKKQAFEMFGLKQTNHVWSWSAISQDGKTVATTVWADQVDRTSDASLFVDTFNLPHNQRNELWRDANGNRERIQHLSHAVKHNSGIVRVLLVHSVDPNAYPREVKPNSVEPLTERYFQVVKLDEKTGEFQLRELKNLSWLNDFNEISLDAIGALISEARKEDDEAVMNILRQAITERIEFERKFAGIYRWENPLDKIRRDVIVALGDIARKKSRERYQLEEHEAKSEFLFADGKPWPSISEHHRLMDICRQIETRCRRTKGRDPQTGEIFEQDGLRLLCLNAMASYGGGSAALWAAEGFDAQLTMQGTPYVRGKCLEIIEEPLGIKFQPVGRGWMDYEDEERRQEVRFLKLEEIRRYDINHRESEWYRHPR